MAACTLTTATIEGRIADRFFGLDVGSFNYDDYQNSTFAALADAVSPGWYRIINFINPTGTAAVPDSTHSGYAQRRQFILDRIAASLSSGLPTVKTPGVLFGARTGPINPFAAATTIQPSATRQVASDGTGASPADTGDHVTWWMTHLPSPAPLYFKGVEFYNEPGTEAGSWFNTPVPQTSAANWDRYQHRYFYNAVKAVQPNAKVALWAASNVSSANGDSGITGFFGLQGTWVWPDSNVPYCDVVTVHAYTDIGGGQRTVQNQNNAHYATSWNQGSFGSALNAGLGRIRAILDANGGTAKRILVSEWQIENGASGTQPVNFLGSHSAVAIVAARNAIANKVDGFCIMGATSSDSVATTYAQYAVRSGTNVSNYTYSLQPGFFVYKQFARFFRTYQNSVVPNWTSRTETTPPGTYNNPVPSAQMFAAVNDAANKVGVLCHNANASASVTIAITLDATPSAATVSRWTPATPAPSTSNSALDFPTSTITPVGNVVTITLAPDETAILEIPAAISPGPPPAVPTNSVAPAISGTTTSGYALTNDHGTWTGSPTSYAYQWQVLVSGTWQNATVGTTNAQNYIAPPEYVGSSLRVRVIATNTGGASVAAFSTATSAITQGPLDPAVRADEAPLFQDGRWAGPIQNGLYLPRISSNMIKTDGTGLAHNSQAYRTDIQSSDVGLVQTVAQVGAAGYAFALWARVQNPNNATTMRAYLCSFSDGGGWRFFKCTAGGTFTLIGPVVATNTPVNGMMMKFTVVGSTLKLEVSTSGGASWTTVMTQIDSTVTGAGTVGTEVYDATDLIAINTFDQVAVAAGPVNTVAPVVSGSAGAGSTLSVAVGTWSNTPTSFTYQWTRGGSSIAGATDTVYTTADSDVGSAIGCSVTATNANASTVANSNTITVTQVLPVNTIAPVVTGLVSSGAALVAGTGTWDHSPTGYTYQWQKSAANDGAFSDITGETSSTYIVETSPGDAAYRCVVTATNGAGSSSAPSNVVVGPHIAIHMWDGHGSWRLIGG